MMTCSIQRLFLFTWIINKKMKVRVNRKDYTYNIAYDANGDILDYDQGSIDDNWKQNDQNIRSVEFSKSENISIGTNAFNSCGLVGSLVIPGNITSVGNYSFYNCDGLNGTLTIENGVQVIGSWSFNNCNNFNGSLKIPSTVNIVGPRAFENCSGFDGELIIEDGVKILRSISFRSCTNLKGTLTIPQSVTLIENGCFRFCSSITRVEILATTAPTIGTTNVFADMTSVSPAEIHVPIGSVGYLTEYNGLEVVYDL